MPLVNPQNQLCMFSVKQFDLIKLFVSDVPAATHVYGHVDMVSGGTIPINSAGESTCDYFLSSNTVNGITTAANIAGHPCEAVAKIELVMCEADCPDKPKTHLIIQSIK